ncbi:MAG: response regulator [Bdellovibrionales bacterium]|nr:response regulator [Bdellovibrionales bacterium]
MAKILIVDDDTDILKFTDALLTQAEHEVKTATDPIMAMDFLNNRQFDLIITDANMPHYTGFELVKTIRSDIRYKNVGIAMLTGMREKLSIEKAIKVGVDDYIVKPIDPLIFLRKIDNLLQKRPPQKKQELAFSSISAQTEAKLKLETQLISVSEDGLKIRTQFSLPLGCLMTIESSLFHLIDIETPPLKVLSCEKFENETQITLGFVGLSEHEIEKVRSWVYKELSKRKHKVS